MKQFIYFTFIIYGVFCYSGTNIYNYNKHIKDGLDNYQSIEKCDLKIADEKISQKVINKIKTKKCNPWKLLDPNQKGKNTRLWHKNQKGYLACLEELPNAQKYTDKIVSDFFATQLGAKVLRNQFCCDKKLISHFFATSNKGLYLKAKNCSKLPKHCKNPSLMSKNLSYKSLNFQGSHYAFLQKLQKHSKPRKILFLIGNTPAQCIDSFTFSESVVLYGVPSAELKYEEYRDFMIHEILIGLDAGYYWGFAKTHPYFEKDSSRYSILLQNRLVGSTTAALRAFILERQMLLEKSSKIPKNRYDLQLVKGILDDERKCRNNFKRIFRLISNNLPKEWITSNSISHALLYGRKNYIGPATIHLDRFEWKKLSTEEALIEIDQEFSKKGSEGLCKAMVKPQINGFQLLDSDGPRPRIRGN